MVGVGMVPLEHAAQVDAVVCRIDERVGRRTRSDLWRRLFYNIRFKLETALDSKFSRGQSERRDGYRIAEHVMRMQ